MDFELKNYIMYKLEIFLWLSHFNFYSLPGHIQFKMKGKIIINM